MLFTYADINFLHFAVILFVICTTVLVVVSLLTAPPPPEKLEGLTFAVRTPVERRETEASWRKRDAGMSVLVVLAVCLVWFYFS